MSEDLIATLHPDVQPLARAMLDQAAAQGIPLRVVSARRSCAEQARLYAQGRTAPGRIVTNARGCQSWHTLGRAFDVAGPNDASTWDAVGAIGESLGLTWGKHFSGGLNDLPHFQYTGGMTIEQACPDPDDCEGAAGGRSPWAGFVAGMLGAAAILGARKAGWI